MDGEIIVHNRHIDALPQNEGLDACFYGPWGAENDYVKMPFESSVNMKNYVLRISFRAFSFCNWEDDSIYLKVLDDKDNVLKIWEKSRDDVADGCDLWDAVLDTQWYDDETCLDACSVDHLSCYQDVELSVNLADNKFTLIFGSDIDIVLKPGERTTTVEGDRAWGYANLEMFVEARPTIECCTGTRRDYDSADAKPKLCSAFGEQRNCENKECDWDITDDASCQIGCCRFEEPEDGSNERNPVCKNTNYDLDICREERDDCVVTNCDQRGFQNGLVYEPETE
jgi:hypothetical protein